MKIRTLRYYIHQAFRSIARNGLMSIASAATVTVSLIILGTFVLLVAGTNYAARTIESEVEIAAFLNVDAAPDAVQQTGDEIRALQGVSSVDLVTKEEGLAQLNEQFGKDHDLMAALGDENPLPDYYLVKAVNPQDVPAIAGKINRMADVDTVNYGQGVVEKLFSLVRWVRIGGISIICLLAMAALFLIAISIRMTIFARKKEIHIMQCVGATSWFIRWPFVFEGMFLGLVGSVLAGVVLFVTYTYLIGKVASALTFLPIMNDVQLLAYVLLVVVLVGPAVGAMGSMLSLRRYLNV